MSSRVPNTPFSTRLSGSAKETELRIRSIFQWKKKRPPAALIVLTALAVLLCFSLFSCVPAVPEGLTDNIERWLEESPQGEADGREIRWILEEVTPSNRSHELDGVVGQIYEIVCRSESGAQELTASLLIDPDTLEIMDVESMMVDGKEEPEAEPYPVTAGKASDLDVLTDSGVILKVSGYSAESGAVSYTLKNEADIPYYTGFSEPSIQAYQDGQWHHLETRADRGVLSYSAEGEAVQPGETYRGSTDFSRYGDAVPDGLYRLVVAVSETPTGKRSYLAAEFIVGDEFAENTPAPDEPGNTGEIVPPSQYEQIMRYQLSLDEIGAGDDKVALTIYRDQEGPTGQVDLTVYLGSGETLTWDLSNEEVHYFSPELWLAYLTSATRQSIIVQLNSIASAYGFAQYYVVEVIDGVLVVTDLSAGRETLNDFSLVYHPVTGLAHVRLLLLNDVVTLGYNDGAWSEVELDPMDAYERNKQLAAIVGLDRMPLDELPQELLDSLTLVSETDLSGSYTAEYGWYRTYTAPGLEIVTSAPSAAYLKVLKERDGVNGIEFATEEDFYAYIEGEEGREWLLNVTVTDDSFATLYGLKVGMTCEQAKELGYNLDEGRNFTGNVEDELRIDVENGVVVRMRKVWTMGRYIGKFFEL